MADELIQPDETAYRLELTAAQLKIFQEVITIAVFVVFAWLYLGESPRWNEVVAFLMVLGAVVVATLPR